MHKIAKVITYVCIVCVSLYVCVLLCVCVCASLCVCVCSHPVAPTHVTYPPCPYFCVVSCQVWLLYLVPLFTLEFHKERESLTYNPKLLETPRRCSTDLLMYVAIFGIFRSPTAMAFKQTVCHLKLPAAVAPPARKL